MKLLKKFALGVPTDPYDGQPLRFRKVEDGIAVYSIGDGKEETVMRRRGNGDPLADLGQGWKLWNPEHRALPAVPVPDVQIP